MREHHVAVIVCGHVGALLTEDMARSMARHSCIEYRNLAKKLPQLYREANGLES